MDNSDCADSSADEFDGGDENSNVEDMLDDFTRKHFDLGACSKTCPSPPPLSRLLTGLICHLS